MNTEIVHVFYAVCWVSILVFTFVFFYVLVKWIAFAVWPIKSIKINYYHDDNLLESRTINLSNDEYFVRQLRSASRETQGE